MKNNTKALLLTVLTIGATRAAADVWPQDIDGGMKHIAISLDGSDVVAHPDLDASPLQLINFGETHFAPADVLDGKAYNNQYGWIFEGFTTPNAGEAIWVEVESQTAGLETYEGGMRPMKPNHTYDALFGTDASSTAWRFDRVMTHNWYAVTSPGEYEATYKVYVGDEITGVENLAYTPANVTLSWTNVPEPASVLLLAGGALAFIGRRRNRSEGRG